MFRARCKKRIGPTFILLIGLVVIVIIELRRSDRQFVVAKLHINRKPDITIRDRPGKQ
jgi:hypothetical protein